MNKWLTNNVGRIFPAFLFLLLNCLTMKGAGSPSVPDFAFPQAVALQSDSLLKKAILHHDNVEAIRQAMNLVIARNLLSDSQNSGPSLQLTDSVAQCLVTPFSNVAHLVAAEILSQTYLQDRYTYDQRNLPLDTPFPPATDEWSGQMFKQEILALIDKATDQINSKTLSKSPGIKEFSPLLTDCSTAEKINMTVEDFLAFKSVEILKNFISDNSAILIPFYQHESEASIEGECKAKAVNMLNLLISGNSNSIIKALAYRELYNIVPDFEKESLLRKGLTSLEGTEGEGLLVYTLWNAYFRNSQPNENKEIYPLVCDWLLKFPSGFYSENLYFVKSQIESQRIEVSFPKLSLPGQSISGMAKVCNLERAYILVYKLNESQVTNYDEVILSKFSGTSRPLQVIEISNNGSTPFNFEQSIEISGLNPGIYVCVPSVIPSLPKGWNKASSNAGYSTFRVSDIAIFSTSDSNEKDSGRVYVVNARNQKPVAGAIVTYYSGNSKKAKGKLITNSQGYVKIPQGYYRIEARYASSLIKKEAGFSYYPQSDNNELNASILTDLALYRPGDTVRFAVVGWRQDNLQNSLLKSAKIDVTLRDVNYVATSQVSLELDENGRAAGELVIPKGRLSGNYQLTAAYPDSMGRTAGASFIRVEEYRLPAFQVTLSQEETSSPDSLFFKGIAQTYAGMPVGEAEVTVKVEFQPWRWGWASNNASFSQALTTQPDGSFSLSLPIDNLRGTIFATGRYSMTAQVTSQAGETQTSPPLYFYLGKASQIRPTISDQTEIKSDSLDLYVPVFDMAGLPIIEKLNYRIINLAIPSDTISGEFTSPSFNLDARNFKSGNYRFEFKAPDSEDWIAAISTLWRTDDKNSPYPTSLWIPPIKYSYNADQTSIDVKFGSYWPEWLLFTLSDGKRILETDWISPCDTLITRSVNIPQGNPTLFVTLCGLHNFEAETGQITILPAHSLDKMEIAVETFRDKISAGELENWKFSFNIGKKPASFTNAFAVMTDRALNAITDFNWNFNIYRPSVYNKFRVNTVWNSKVSSYKNIVADSSRKFTLSGPAIPQWQTYGYPFVAFPLRIEAPMYYKAMAASRNAIADTAAMKVEEASDEAIEQEAAITTGTSDSVKEVELRPVEMPLAFFMPNLKADKEGQLEINFTVPNFNTTWQLQIAGYNEELMTASKILDAVASKPVMVKSNLPQFLRTGDKAKISATLFNNSQKEELLRGKIQIIDPWSGEIIKDEEFDAEKVMPSRSRVVSLHFDVANNLSGVIVRAYALTDNHSDGEQGFVAVLPSSTPVTESTAFYASSAQETIEVKIPRLSKDANVTLKYCDNPLWEVLLSLPSLTLSENPSSLSLANWLYATLTSRNIIDSNPAIYSGLQNILHSEDSTLTLSNLQKDNNLKIASLEATPWINQANAETLRIRSLEKYFDATALDAQVENKIQALQHLQTAEGGWSWLPGLKSSPYITERIIQILGYLNSQGVLTHEMELMARKSVKYYDSWIIEREKENKLPGLASLSDYFYSRNMLGYEMSQVIKRIQQQTLDSLSKEWRYYDLGRKAKAAILFWDSEDYREEGLTIMNSISQFLDKTNPLSQEALMLQLFNRYAPDSEFADKIRQEMMLQKETREWNDEYDAPGIIYALMQGIPKDNIQRSLPQILIGGKELDLSSTQALTGNFTLNLDPREVSGKKLVIRREGGIPAWGGVINQYVAPIRTVKAEKIENLSIEKKIYKEDAKGNLKEVAEFKKGDKITVTLTLSLGKDMDYVVIADSRAACMQPDDNKSGIIFVDGLGAYREIGKEKTSFFIERLPAGKHIISYECHADRDGEYSLGIAETQCLYSPSKVAHSAGRLIKINQDLQD